LIAGSSHAGKSSIGQYLTKEHSLAHYELSALVHKHYENAIKDGTFSGSRDDFLEYELCKEGNRDFVVKELLKGYDGYSNIVISGPRFAEEIEALIAHSDWNILPLYIHSDPKIRLDRYLTFKKEHSLSSEPTESIEISFEEFLRNDMRQASWGLAKIATMTELKMFINHDGLGDFLNKVKSHTDSVITRWHFQGY